MLKVARYLIGTAGILCVLAANGCSDRHGPCIEKVFAEDIAAKTKWHEELRTMIVQERPELELPATVSRDLQLLLLEKRDREFNFLWVKHREAVESRGGLALFRNYKWKEDYAQELRRQDPRYAEVEKRISDLKEKNRELPQWEEYRDFFENTLVKTPAFRGLAGEMARREKALEDQMAVCRELDRPKPRK